MFWNRELRVRVAKDDKKTKDEPERPMKEDRLPAYTNAAKKIVITGALVVYGYVIVDTFRQVNVAQAIYNREDD